MMIYPNEICSKVSVLKYCRFPFSFLPPSIFHVWRKVVCFVEMFNSNCYNNKSPLALDTTNGCRKPLIVSLNLATVVRHVGVHVRVYVQPISINDQRCAIVMIASSMVHVDVVVSSFSQSDSLDRCPYSNHHYRNHLMNLSWMTMMMNLNCLNYPMQNRWPLSNLHFQQFQPCPALSPENFNQKSVECFRF